MIAIKRETECNWFAECSDIRVASCGKTRDEAIENIKEAVCMFFEQAVERGTLKDDLEGLGWFDEGKGAAEQVEELKKLVDNATDAIEDLRAYKSLQGGLSAIMKMGNMARAMKKLKLGR